MPQESSSQVPKKSVAIKINNDWFVQIIGGFITYIYIALESITF